MRAILGAFGFIVFSFLGIALAAGSDATACTSVAGQFFVNNCPSKISVSWKNQFGNCSSKGCRKEINPGDKYPIQGSGSVSYEACFLAQGSNTCLPNSSSSSAGKAKPDAEFVPLSSAKQQQVKKNVDACLKQVDQCKAICGEVFDLTVKTKCNATCTDKNSTCAIMSKGQAGKQPQYVDGGASP